MTRWLKPALFTLVLIAPAFGQFGGMRFPGMGGRNQGGQRGNSGSSDNPVYGPTETLTGSIREISGTDLVLDAGDDRIILIQIAKNTKYASTMGKVKAADFEPGDGVTVDAIEDNDSHYHSKTITMNKKGTPEEKAAEMKAASSTSASSDSGSSAPNDDSDPDRPRLHRSNPDAASAPASQSVPESTQGSSSSDTPTLIGSAPASTSGSTDSGNGSPAVIRPPTSQPAPVYRPTSSESDDSGPPVLRRSSSPAAAAGAGSDNRVASTERPSLSAEDVNGVTREPVAPPPSEPGSGGAAPNRGVAYPAPSSGDPIIDQARDVAFSFSETLPNYVVKRITSRYQTESANRGRTSWQALDIVTTDLVYEDGKERYTNIMVNGKPTKSVEETGSWSTGEFGSMLQAILAPETRADFRNQRPSTIANRAAYRYDYTVEQPRSTWTLHADGRSVTPSYTGAIWIDKETKRVLRIEIASRNVPRDFPLDTAESSIDYDFVAIETQRVLLPVHAESLSCVRGTSDCTRNVTEFRNYHKYGADTSITFEGADK